jgi:hypothetical protein
MQYIAGKFRKCEKLPEQGMYLSRSRTGNIFPYRTVVVLRHHVYVPEFHDPSCYSVVIQPQSGIVAIEGYLRFERVISLYNLFPFPLASALLLGDVMLNRQSGVNMLLSTITAPIVLAHLIDFLIRRCYVNPLQI